MRIKKEFLTIDFFFSSQNSLKGMRISVRNIFAFNDNFQKTKKKLRKWTEKFHSNNSFHRSIYPSPVNFSSIFVHLMSIKRHTQKKMFPVKFPTFLWLWWTHTAESNSSSGINSVRAKHSSAPTRITYYSIALRLKFNFFFPLVSEFAASCCCWR